MSVRENILKAALGLAEHRPVDQISFADIAQAAGVHWTTVRRHLGSKQDMRKLLAEHQEGAQGNADTRTRILDAATHVFSQRGYTGATLDEIAEHAGLTKGAVYWHFSSKSDLYIALCERSLSQQLQQMPTQIAPILDAPNPASALARWMLTQFEVCVSQSEKPMLFFEFIASSREPAIRDRLQQAYSVMFESMGTFLQSLQERGLFANDVDAKSVAIMMHALVNGVIQTWLVNPENVQFDSLVEQMSRVLWKGLQP